MIRPRPLLPKKSPSFRAIDKGSIPRIGFIPSISKTSSSRECDAKAAKRFFKRLLCKHRGEPRKIVTDKLRSYNEAHRELIAEVIHDTTQYANNRAELLHEPTRVRERGMWKFKSMEQAQCCLAAHADVYNLFNLGCHLLSAENYRHSSARAFATWEKAVAI